MVQERLLRLFIFQQYKSFIRKSERKFHGIACYTRNSMHEHVLRIPEEDKELEIIHMLVKNTVPNTNIIGVYLDCEKDAIKTERVWTKLVAKVETALGRGEEVYRDHGRISGTLGGGMHRLRLRKEGPEDAHTEGETDILEEDEGKDRGQE